MEKYIIFTIIVSAVLGVSFLGCLMFIEDHLLNVSKELKNISKTLHKRNRGDK